MENTLIAYNGIEVYKSDIDLLCDEYVETLGNPEIVYKSYGFSGLLEYIYSHCLKNIVISQSPYDYDVLNDIFYNVYVPLSSRYGNTPTIVQFCSMLKIDNHILGNAKKGVYDGGKVNNKVQSTVKNWFNTCEAGLLGRAVSENGVGAIFALKANYGYREASTVTVEQVTQAHDTAEQIAARHHGAMLPERPDL